MNEQNLVSLADRTPEERREIARSGGLASGEAKRERKLLKEELLAVLEERRITEAVCAGLIRKAIRGDVRAFIALRDTIGEKPVENIEIDNRPWEYEKAREEVEQFFREQSERYTEEQKQGEAI